MMLSGGGGDANHHNHDIEFSTDEIGRVAKLVAVAAVAAFKPVERSELNQHSHRFHCSISYQSRSFTC